MKIIVSHDVDHITFWEHNNDLIIPKFVVRGFIELGLRYVSISEVMSRLKNIIQNKWHNLVALMKYNKENEIPSTFFIGVANGKGLNYSLKSAQFWVKKILDEGFDVGVHGIAFDNYDDIKKEYDTFKNISGLEKFGIRMHYLCNSTNTLDFLNKASYLYDTTLYKLENPFKIGGLWEFPLHLMDASIIRKNNGWQNMNIMQIKEATERMIEEACNNGINYLTINFHDSFFNDSFKTWKEWYMWLIRYLKDNKFEFKSYNDAIKELGELSA